MAQLLNVQLQDANGNIYYLQTSGDSVFLSDGTTVTVALQNKISTANIDNNLLGTDPTHVLASPQGKALQSNIDAVSENMLQYYSLNNAIAIPQNADLNDYTEFGNYYCNDASIAATLENCPYTVSGFVLHVERTTGNTSYYKKQRIVANYRNPPIEYWRVLNDNGYGEWHSPVFDNNILSGSTPGITCNANSITTYHIEFDKSFIYTPRVVASIYSNSDMIKYSDLSISVSNISISGFDVKIYNGSSTTFVPAIIWIAFANVVITN